jgi:hypothetical protein
VRGICGVWFGLGFVIGVMVVFRGELVGIWFGFKNGN